MKHIPNLESTIYSSTQPFNRPPWVDNMVRERVSISGVVRPLEPASEMSMLQLDPEDIGLIKEGPVRRYMAGSAFLPSFRGVLGCQKTDAVFRTTGFVETIWDKRFKRTYERVQKRRECESRLLVLFTSLVPTLLNCLLHQTISRRACLRKRPGSRNE